jgi:phospholipid transport system substrate-binding protein
MNRTASLLRAGVCLVSMLVAGSALASNAKDFVDGVATQVIAIAKTDSLSTAQRQAKIEAIFANKVDINFVAKFVLGKHWRTATPKQQQDYIAAYRPFILKNYASKLTKYSGQTYTLKDARADGDASVVTMSIHDTDGQDILVDYRLRGEGGGFRIVDIMVEGVSLLTTQRSEFNGIVESKGLDGLIQALTSQVAAKN